MRRALTLLVLLAYAGGVTAITIFPIHPHPPSYFLGVPWWTMFRWIPFDVDAPSMVLNVIMFVPFGVLLPLLWPRTDTVRRIFWSALAASATIETAQLVIGLTVGSRRTVDVNDLIANSAGALAGLLVLRLAVPEAQHRAVLAAGRESGQSSGSR